MADIVNLRQARKARTRRAAEADAAANRAAFGRTRVEKQADATEADRRNRELDGARREGKESVEP